MKVKLSGEKPTWNLWKMHAQEKESYVLLIMKKKSKISHI